MLLKCVKCGYEMMVLSRDIGKEVECFQCNAAHVVKGEGTWELLDEGPETAPPPTAFQGDEPAFPMRLPEDLKLQGKGAPPPATRPIGLNLPTETVRCPRCGSQRPAGETFCPTCRSTGRAPRHVPDAGPPAASKNLLAVICIAVAAGLILFFVVWLTSGGEGRPLDKKELNESLSNLFILGKSLLEYQRDGGRAKGVARLGKLYPYYVDRKRYYRCPGSVDDPHGWNDRFPMEEKHTSYLCTDALNTDEMSAEEMGELILVYEKKNFHGAGRAVCFANLECKWLPQKEFQEKLKKTLEWAEAHPVE